MSCSVCECVHECVCACTCVCLLMYVQCVCFDSLCSYAVEQDISFTTSMTKPLNVPNATLTACQWLYLCVSQSIEPINKKKPCSQGEGKRSIGTHSAVQLWRLTAQQCREYQSQQ